MSIKEALTRKNPEDVVYIGEVAEAFYMSEAGELLRAVINGHICEEAVANKYDSKIPADRILGRIEGFQTIVDDFEIMIQAMKEMKKPKPKEDEEYL